MNITKRRLTDSEIELLFQELKLTPNIIGATKEEWRNFGNIWVADQEGRLIGVTVNRDLGPSWSEITMLYVLPTFRGVGAGRQLFETAWNEIERRGRNIYVISRNPAVIKMMKEKNMRFVNLLSLPIEIQYYNIRLILNGYRLSEMFRKAFLYHGQSLSFRHAIKESRR